MSAGITTKFIVIINESLVIAWRVNLVAFIAKYLPLKCIKHTYGLIIHLIQSILEKSNSHKGTQTHIFMVSMFSKMLGICEPTILWSESIHDIKL